MRIILTAYLYLIPFITLLACNPSDDMLDNEQAKEYEASVYAYIDGIGKYNGNGAQGFATSGDIGFCFYDSGYCQTIDLNNKTVVASFMLPEGVANPYNHCGVACFSDTYLNEDDKFPLLYLSSYKEYKCYVLRMSESNAELVQVIQMKDDDGNIIPIYAFMPDGDFLVMKSSKTTKTEAGYPYVWQTIKRPDNQQHDCFLFSRDVINRFKVMSSDPYNAGFCKNNKIYQLAGYKGSGSKKLYIIDYKEGVILKEIVWREPFLYRKEHEQCSPYGEDGMLINYNGADYISYIRFFNWIY